MLRTAYCLVFSLSITSPLFAQSSLGPENTDFSSGNHLIRRSGAGAPQPSANATRDSGFYGGGHVAGVFGDRGFVQLEPFSVAGGVVGWRFSETWSAEVHAEYGFGRSPEREVQTIYGTGTRHEEPGEGYSAYAVWKPRMTSRMSAAVTMGLAWQQTRTITTPTVVDPRLPLSDLATETTRSEIGVGLTGGAFFPIALGAGWSLAPEIRLAFLIEGEGGFYPQIYPGVRLMWGF